MFSQLPEELALSFKDKLREMRHHIRSISDGLGSKQRRQLPDLLIGGAAHVLDNALTTAETVSLSLVSSNPQMHFSAPEVKGISVYFASTSDAARLFRRDLYYFVKEIINHRGGYHILVEESAFGDFHSRFTTRHGALLNDFTKQQHQEQRLALAAKIAAQLLMSFHGDVALSRLAGSDNSPLKQALQRCFSTFALLTSLASAKGNELHDINPIEITLLSVDAMSERIDHALDTQNRTELERVYLTLLAHLP